MEVISSFEGGDAAAALNDVQTHDALPSSSQLNTELKKKEASDTEAGSDPVIEEAKSRSSQIKYANQTEGAYISSKSISNVGKPSNKSNVSHAGAGDLTKSSRTPLEAGINTSSRQEVQDTLHEESTQNPSTVEKTRRRKKRNRQLTPSVAADQQAYHQLWLRNYLYPQVKFLPHNSQGLHGNNIIYYSIPSVPKYKSS